MKRSFITSGVILAASFTLTNCALEIVDSDENFNEGIPFEICAGSVDTKTTLDGLATKWASGDAINLFHAATGTEEYVSDGSFTIADADLESGRFTGTLASALEDDAYDWYAFYPYSSYNKTPAGVSQDTFGYTTIGGTSQTQSGNDSMTHLCGKACPLYGIVKDVSVDETPSIKMNHLTSIIEIKVTNNSGNPLTVSSVTFTAPEDIVGTYYINFASTPVAYTEATYATSTAALTVKNAEAIANGASATFYIAVKPFEAVAGDDLKIKVNGYEKSVTVPDGESVEFSAGKIKTLNFDFNTVLPTITDGDYVIMVKDGEKYYAMSSAESSSGRRDFKTIDDYTPGSTYSTVYGDLVWTFEGQSSGFIVSNDGSYIKAESNKVTMVTSQEEASGIYCTGSSDGTFQMTSIIGTETRYLAKNGTYGFGFYASSTGIHDLIIAPATYDATTPTIVVSETNLEVSREAGTGEIAYSIINPADGKAISAASDQTWVSDFDCSVDGKISFNVAENTGEERTANITLSYAGAENVVVTVKQASASGPDYTFITAKSTTNNAYASVYEVTIDGLYWSVPGNQNFDGYVRIGGNSLDHEDRVIYSKSSMAYGINKVVISTNGISNTYLIVNSVTMKVYSNAADAAAGTATPVASFTNTDSDWAVSTAKEITFENTTSTPWSDAFYRFEFNVTNSASKNYGIDLQKIEFYK